MPNKKNNNQQCKNNSHQKNQPAKVEAPIIMTPDELKQIIAEAIVTAEEARAEKKQAQKEAEQQVWSELIGEEDNSKILGRKRVCAEIECAFRIIKNICFISKEKITQHNFTNTLIQAILYICFLLLEGILYTSAFAIAYISIIKIPQIWHAPSLKIAGLEIAVLLCCTVLFIVMLIVARIFRVIKIETKNTKDTNYLLTLFPNVLTIISIIIAAATLYITLKG